MILQATESCGVITFSRDRIKSSKNLSFWHHCACIQNVVVLNSHVSDQCCMMILNLSIFKLFLLCMCVNTMTFTWKWTQQMMNQPQDCIHHCKLQRWHLDYDRKCDELSILHTYTHTLTRAMNNCDVPSCQPYLTQATHWCASQGKLVHLE